MYLIIYKYRNTIYKLYFRKIFQIFFFSNFKCSMHFLHKKFYANFCALFALKKCAQNAASSSIKIYAKIQHKISAET